jgi:hypothetical protein
MAAGQTASVGVTRAHEQLPLGAAPSRHVDSTREVPAQQRQARLSALGVRELPTFDRKSSLELEREPSSH